MKNIALAGNPNTGKTSLFNSLTGAKQRIGNWPGVTIEKKEGPLLNHPQINVIDLPGTYSLGAHTEDEMVARNYLLLEKPDTVINVLDATNLQRNLYLTVQLLEMGVPLIIALNMMDEAEKNEITINVPKLAALLKTPIIPTIARTGEGLLELIETAVAPDKTPYPRPFNCPKQAFQPDYGEIIEAEIKKLEEAIDALGLTPTSYSVRFMALKLLEDGEEFLQTIHFCETISEAQTEAYHKLCAFRKQSLDRLQKNQGENLTTVLIEKRYAFIDTLLKQVINSPDLSQATSFSDHIDRIALNRYLGLPLFFLAILLVFKLTFTASGPLVGLLESFFTRLGELLAVLITNDLLASFLIEGLIGGLGGIIVFLPIILCLFLAISLLENSGYMARGAYLMDRYMRLLGLEGKAIIPLVVGFGCNVPAILATRTLKSSRDRLITVFLIPFMSCGARLPVYALFTGVFFQQHQAPVMFSLYLLGILLAVITARIFGRYLFPGETSPLLIELPPYRMPSLKDTLIQMGEKSLSFFKKVGTIILTMVMISWVLASFPWGVEYAGPDSFMGKLGSLLAPLFAPLGFGTREAASALLFGVVAKEAVVSILGVLYGTGQEALSTVLAMNWTALSAYSFMVMTLLYIPCAGTIGAIKAETGSWKWTSFAVAYTFVLAWLVAFLVYRGGLLLGLV